MALFATRVGSDAPIAVDLFASTKAPLHAVLVLNYKKKGQFLVFDPWDATMYAVSKGEFNTH